MLYGHWRSRHRVNNIKNQGGEDNTKRLPISSTYGYQQISQPQLAWQISITSYYLIFNPSPTLGFASEIQ
jgi:hypothetical protein